MRLLARASASNPIFFLLTALIAIFGFGLVAAGGIDRFDPQGLSVSGSESASAEQRLAAELGYDPEAAILIVASDAVSISSSGATVALETIETRALTLDGVNEVKRSAPDPSGRRVLFALHLDPGLDGDERQDLAEQVQRNLDPGPLEVRVGGRLPAAIQARESLIDDLPALLLLAAPILFVALVIGAGTRLAAGPILAAALAAATAIAGLRLLDGATDTRVIALVGALTVGAILAIELSLLIVGRFGEEAPAFGAGEDTLQQTLARSAPALYSVAVVGALAAVSLLVIPIADARSLAAGAGLAAPLAAAAAALVVPALVMVAGARPPEATADAVDEDSEALSNADETPETSGHGGSGTRAGKIAHVVLGVAALGASIALAIAALNTDVAGFGAAELPAETDAAAAEEAIAAGFGSGASEPVLSVLTERSRASLYSDEVGELPGTVLTSKPRRAGDLTLVESRTGARGGSVEAQQGVKSVRSVEPAGGVVEVGGLAASLLDARETLGARIWLLAGLLAALAGISGFLLSRSRLALSDALLAPLPALAAIGALSFVFGGGRLTGALDYEPVGAPHLGAILAVGICVAVITLSRNASRGGQGLVALRQAGPGASSLELALQSGRSARTPEIVGSVVAVAVGAALLASNLLPVKEFGLGLAVGLLVDLIVLRLLAEDVVARLALPR